MIQARASKQFSLSSEKSRYIYTDCNMEFKHMASRNLMFLVDIKISYPLMSLNVGNFQECGSHN